MPDVSSSHASAILRDSRDGELMLWLDQIYTSDESPWAVPAYRFNVMAGDLRAGTISLRVGDDERLVRYAGHVGFGIDEEFRGNRLAGRAVRLLLPLACSHGLRPLWLGCNPDNAASIRVMEWLGATYVETVDLPPDYDRYYSRGERQKRRFKLEYA
jgi:predicted acetyltransferase